MQREGMKKERRRNRRRGLTFAESLSSQCWRAEWLAAQTACRICLSFMFETELERQLTRAFTVCRKLHTTLLLQLLYGYVRFDNLAQSHHKYKQSHRYTVWCWTSAAKWCKTVLAGTNRSSIFLLQAKSYCQSCVHHLCCLYIIYYIII